MRDSIQITEVAYTPASAALRATGLLGYVEGTANCELRLCGLTLRWKAKGGHSIAFPFRLDAHGVRRPYMRPIDARARAEIERQILGALRRQGVIR